MEKYDLYGEKTMNIIGLNAYHGDAAAAILVNGKLLFAAEEERFNRIKHSAGLPKAAFQNTLEKSGISLSDIDYLTVSREPAANFIPKLQFILKSHPPFLFLKDRFSISLQSGKLLENLGLVSGKNGKYHAKNVRVEHHLSHAASAFYPSGFDRAALLTVDGFGDFSSVMFGIGEGNRIKILKRILFPHSLGILYTAATQYLGFPHYGDEYKIMGLAGFGEPKFLKEFRKLISLRPDGTFQLDLSYFSHTRGEMEMSWREGEPVLGRAYSEKWRELFGPPRHPEEPLTQKHKDIAASAQAVFEEVFFHLLNHLHKQTKMKNACLAGGCVQNSVANGKIFDETPFEKVYIQPAAGDAGTALGGALYMAHHRFNQPRNFVMDHAYWGPAFGETEINEVLQVEELKKGSYQIEKVSELQICQKASRAIADGKVVGWFQGRMEWGPRALGNRSILADPRRAEMKDILNARIKQRENFRPFAPSVLEEKASDWFQMKTRTSPFMNFVFPVRPEKRDKIPSVVHVDGTARVHTVSKQNNPLFWNLINEFEKITGVPLVLNTSFNENEPIVCSPNHALGCFLRTKMDVLVLGLNWIERKEIR